MGRPKAPEDQQVSARRYYLQGLTAKAIMAILELEYEMPVSLRTVGRWVTGFTSSGLQVKAANGMALTDRCDLTDHTWMMDRWYRGMALTDRCDLTDHTWMMDRRYEGTDYTREDVSAVANNLVNIRSKRTCLFCNRVEITRP